jgi:hypothetical protein
MLCAKVSRRFLPLLLVVAASLTTCDRRSPLGPESQVEVTKYADHFLMQVRFMDDGTETLTYDWENTGTQASIHMSASVPSGSVRLTIEDHAGTVVFDDELANDDDIDTSVGVAGNWTIVVRIEDATGTFDLTIQKKT